MIKRSFFFLIIFGALFLAVFFSGDIYKQNDSENNGKWKKIETERIDKIEITRKGEKNILKRKGERWGLTDPIVADVDSNAISELLKGIENMTVDTLISTKKEKRSLFQVDESGVAVTIFNKEEHILGSFVIGKAAPDFNHTYVRQSDSDEVYLAKGFKRHQFDKDAKVWRNRTVLTFNKDDAVTITLTSKTGMIIFQKEGEEWEIREPEVHKADKNKINTILNFLSHFNATDFEDTKGIAETSLDSPELEIVVESMDQELGKILVGKEDNDKIYVKNAESDQIFFVRKARFDNLKKGVEYYKATPN